MKEVTNKNKMEGLNNRIIISSPLQKQTQKKGSDLVLLKRDFADVSSFSFILFNDVRSHPQT